MFIRMIERTSRPAFGERWKAHRTGVLNLESCGRTKAFTGLLHVDEFTECWTERLPGCSASLWISQNENSLKKHCEKPRRLWNSLLNRARVAIGTLISFTTRPVGLFDTISALGITPQFQRRIGESKYLFSTCIRMIESALNRVFAEPLANYWIGTPSSGSFGPMAANIGSVPAGASTEQSKGKPRACSVS